MQLLGSFILIGILGTASAYEFNSVVTSLVPCMQDIGTEIAKFTQVLPKFAATCSKPQAPYTDFDKDKNGLLSSLTSLKTVVETLINCASKILNQDASLQKIWDPAKKLLEDAVKQLGSLIEEAKKASNITDLCKCFYNSLKNIIDSLLKVLVDLVANTPSYIKDLANGIIEIIKVWVTLLSPTADGDVDELKKALQNGFELKIRGLKALKDTISGFNLLGVKLTVVIEAIDAIINLANEYAGKIKVGKNVADLKQTLNEYVEKALEALKNILSKLSNLRG